MGRVENKKKSLVSGSLPQLLPCFFLLVGFTQIIPVDDVDR
jgi:hypothetical protein